MKRIIAFIGKAGAGKDSVAKALYQQLPNSHMMVSCTTRPKRDYEVEGVDYYFLTGEEFAEKVLANEMLEATCFNDWFYGTPVDTLQDGWNIGVFNPTGIESLMDYAKTSIDVLLYPFYIQASDKTRLMRQLTREENPDVKEIIRRYSADEMDFADIDDNTLPIYIINNDGDTTIQDVVDEILPWAQEHS